MRGDAVPHEILTLEQVARYLHMDAREVARLVERGRIPSHARGGQPVFRKSEVDHWVEAQMHALPRERLAQIEAGVRAHHEMEPESEGVFVAAMIPPGGIAVPLRARTREGAIRDLVDLAKASGMVYGKDELLDAVRQREDLCSTSVRAGIALPHPRHPLPWDIAASFIVVGRTAAGVPFGAPDGSLTRLFFLICCKDDRTHLHVLARLGRILHEDRSVQELMEAPDADALRAVLDHHEREALSCPPNR